LAQNNYEANVNNKYKIPGMAKPALCMSCIS